MRRMMLSAEELLIMHKTKNIYTVIVDLDFFWNPKRLSLLLLFISFLLIFLSCHKENTNPEQFFTGKSYFPINTGNEIIYKITEINIDKASAIFDTTIYQIKERVDSIFIDASGKPAYRIARYYRTDSTAQWVIKDVWSAQVNELNAQKVEENIRYIKLVFPAETGQIWNGNAYNNLNEQDYQIVSTNIADTIQALAFDSVLTVEQKNEETLISKQYAAEKFANGIGLVYKEITDLYSQSMIGSGIPIEERVDEGTIFIQEVIGFSVAGIERTSESY